MNQISFYFSFSPCVSFHFYIGIHSTRWLHYSIKCFKIQITEQLKMTRNSNANTSRFENIISLYKNIDHGASFNILADCLAFDLEGQGGVFGNVRRGSIGTVSHLGWNGQTAFSTNLKCKTTIIIICHINT